MGIGQNRNLRLMTYFFHAGSNIHDKMESWNVLTMGLLLYEHTLVCYTYRTFSIDPLAEGVKQSAVQN